jgi:hypothetical protein
MGSRVRVPSRPQKAQRNLGFFRFVSCWLAARFESRRGAGPARPQKAQRNLGFFRFVSRWLVAWFESRRGAGPAECRPSQTAESSEKSGLFSFCVMLVGRVVRAPPGCRPSGLPAQPNAAQRTAGPAECGLCRCSLKRV